MGNNALYEKQRNADLLNKRNRLAKRYEDFIESGAASQSQDGDPGAEQQSIEDLESAELQLNRVRNVIGDLRGKFGHLDEVLERVLLLADVGVDGDQQQQLSG